MKFSDLHKKLMALGVSDLDAKILEVRKKVIQLRLSNKLLKKDILPLE